MKTYLSSEITNEKRFNAHGATFQMTCLSPSVRRNEPRFGTFNKNGVTYCTFFFEFYFRSVFAARVVMVMSLMSYNIKRLCGSTDFRLVSNIAKLLQATSYLKPVFIDYFYKITI